MQDTVAVSSSRMEDGDIKALDNEEQSSNLVKDEQVPRKVSSFKLVLLVLAGIAVILLGINIAVTVSSGNENEVVNEDDEILRGCQGLSEAEKQSIRELIAENADFGVLGEIFSVTLENIDIQCLPNDALSLLQVREQVAQATSVQISITNCNVEEAEEEAFRGIPLIELKSPLRVTLDLSKNDLSSLPDLIFYPFREVTGLSIVLIENAFKSFPNELILFKLPPLQNLILDGNRIDRVPVVSNSRTPLVSCKGCSELQFIDRNYCVFNDANLRIDDTPLAIAGKNLLDSYTSCSSTRIRFDSALEIDAVSTDCEGISVSERVFLRKLVAENSILQPLNPATSFELIFTPDVNISCLPEDALNLVAFPENLSSLNLKFENLGIVDVDEKAFVKLETELPLSVTYTLSLKQNQLTFLRENVFAPFRGRELSDINLSGNALTALPSTLVKGIVVSKVDLSENLFTSLPLFPKVLAFDDFFEGFTLLCNSCKDLFEINEGYCELTFAEGEVILELEDTPVVAELGLEGIATLTGCEVEKILIN